MIPDLSSAAVHAKACWFIYFQGIQLRKVEERRLKTVQRQQTKVKGHLDVQSIMEAAFEMRRKALDENDSDDDDDELDNNWSDEN